MSSQQPPHDPFPMRSEEAKAMEESVVVSVGSGGGGSTTTTWNTMSTTTNEKDTTSTQQAQQEDDPSSNQQQGFLMGGGRRRSSSKKKNNNEEEDIYADLDEEEALGGGNHNDEDDDDEFLDRPLFEIRSRGITKLYYKCKRLLEHIIHKLYGKTLTMDDMVRTLTLASTLFFMIGGYWLLRSLKDPVLTALCGVTVIPKAKMVSVFVVLFVVSIYNHMLDSDQLQKHQLFYIFGTFYFVLFLLIALLLKHPTIGLPNEQPSPYRVLGWISYCSIESFGSVMVSLFWSFANSNITLETAKASYGVMVATAQVGSILGPTFVNYAAPKYGPANCYVVGAFCMLLLQCTMYKYVHTYGVVDDDDDHNGATKDKEGAGDSTKESDKKKKKKPKAGILEGLVLFWKHDYVKGIFAISCLFMVEVTIVDYTMKVLAQQYFAEEYPCSPGMSCYNAIAPGEHGSSQAATAAFSAFMGFFGQATNILSFLLSLLGTSAVIRYLGLRWTLLLFPSLCLVVIITVRLNPTLYTVFAAMMALKASSYALNNPTKEILYQPTSPAVKYKAKSWIDIFGARGSKALGSIVTNAFSDSAKQLVANGSLVGMAVATFLIGNAVFMGRKFDEYTSTNFVVGGDDENDAEGDSNIEMAVTQNENKDTSCAIYEDDDEVGPEEEGQSESKDDEDDIDVDDDDEDADDDDFQDVHEEIDHEENVDFAKKPNVERV